MPARPSAQAKAAPLLRHDWHENLNRFIAHWAQSRKLDARDLTRDERQSLIVAIQENGGFQAPRATAYVASLLNVSRATIYNELAALKGGFKETRKKGRFPVDNYVRAAARAGMEAVSALRKG